MKSKLNFQSFGYEPGGREFQISPGAPINQALTRELQLSLSYCDDAADEIFEVCSAFTVMPEYVSDSVLAGLQLLRDRSARARARPPAAHLP
jgi:hypothetical protein